MKQRRRQQSAFTLVEIMIVVVIMTIVMSLSLPALSQLLAGNKAKAALQSVRAMLATAQSRAAELQCNVGIRFQFDKDGWDTGRQYMVLVMNNGAITNSMVAVTNTKPIPVPNGVAIMATEYYDIVNKVALKAEAEKNDALDDSYDNISPPIAKNSLLGHTTFLIIFSPSGSVAVRNDVSVLARKNNAGVENDPIFSSNITPENLALPATNPGRALLFSDMTIPPYVYLSGPGEVSQISFYIAEVDKIRQCNPKSRWTDYISSLKPYMINIHTGQLLESFP